MDVAGKEHLASESVAPQGETVNRGQKWGTGCETKEAQEMDQSKKAARAAK